MRHLLVLAALLGFLAGASPAAATEFCNLRPTDDGFIALRAGPSAKAKLIARMKPEDEVMPGLEQKGRWVSVTWWPGLSRHEEGGFARGIKGWVHGSLIDDMCG